MADFYKFEIANWNEGTAMLTLEQEAAYLRIVNAIRLSDQPISFNKFALCGLWRCNERKAKRLLEELISAGKIRLEDGKIVNDKAVDAASALSRLRAGRASAGSRGGIESGKSRRKALEFNETGEASASTREEKSRAELTDTNVSVFGAHSAPPKPGMDQSRNSSPSRGKRLPPDWSPPAEFTLAAITMGMSEQETKNEADRFRDYWIGKAGRDATKADWLATWRNWCRRFLDDRRSSRTIRPAPISMRTFDGI